MLENSGQEAADLLVAQVRSRGSGGALAQLVGSITAALREADLPKTRLIITDDLVATVNAREDIPATDEVVRVGLHLQTWADGLGFDFHDRPQGGFFRIKIRD